MNITDIASSIGNFFQGFNPFPQTQSQPLQQPQGNAVNTKFGQVPFQGPKTGKGAVAATPLPTTTPMPRPTSTPAFNNDFKFDYESMPRDDYWAANGPRPNFQPNQPPPEIAQIFRDIFPNEATKAATIAVTENAQFDPRRPDAENKDKQGNVVSRDRGIFQVNDNTFNSETEKFREKLKAKGINSYEDMWDPKKNAIFAKHLLDTYGAGRWFGWQDTGYDLNNNLYSKADRADYEVKQLKQRKKK